MPPHLSGDHAKVPECFLDYGTLFRRAGHLSFLTAAIGSGARVKAVKFFTVRDPAGFYCNSVFLLYVTLNLLVRGQQFFCLLFVEFSGQPAFRPCESRTGLSHRLSTSHEPRRRLLSCGRNYLALQKLSAALHMPLSRNP